MGKNEGFKVGSFCFLYEVKSENSDFGGFVIVVLKGVEENGFGCGERVEGLFLLWLEVLVELGVMWVLRFFLAEVWGTYGFGLGRYMDIIFCFFVV